MKPIHICFACDAGMGSSALGASLLRKHMKNMNIKISNMACNQLTNDIDVIITQEQLVGLIKDQKRYKKIFTMEHYMDDTKLKLIVKEIKQMMEKEILSKNAIVTNCVANTSDEAITAIGNVLLENGYIEEPYIEGMLVRDHSVTTYIGNDIAIPHGEYEVKPYVKETGLAVMIYPEGIDWHGAKVRIVIGIAAKDNDHMEILSNIALKLCEMETVNAIVDTQDKEYIYNVLTR
jgi:PTS system mannitol-specific IIC component